MKKNVSKMTDLLALTVFAVFAMCVLTVLLYGADGYQNLVQRGENSFRMRTAAQYVSTRVRQAEKVTVTDFDGCEALTVTEEIDGVAYVTRVYCCGGYLRELFCAQSAALSPEDGEKILPVESLHFSVDGDVLTVLSPDWRIILQLRGKGAVGS